MPTGLTDLCSREGAEARLIDGPQGPREGFFKFYNELWDEKELGPKPVKDPLDLLQRKADGSPYFIQLKNFSPWPIYHGCLNNPNWRAVMKAFVKRGIGRGVDGFIINYFYTNGCMCQYCVRGFKEHLRQRRLVVHGMARLQPMQHLGVQRFDDQNIHAVLHGSTHATCEGACHNGRNPLLLYVSKCWFKRQSSR